MKLIQLLILIFACLGMSYLLLENAPETRIYTADEINAAHSKAVQLARDGNNERAALQLRALLKYSPKNQALWIDYLTVLHWNQQDRLALSLMGNVKLSTAPEYFLSAMYNAANSQQSWLKLLDITGANLKFKSSTDINQKYWDTLDELLQTNETAYAINLLQHLQAAPELSSNDLYLLINKYKSIDHSEQAAALKASLQQHPAGSENLRRLWLEEQDALIARKATEQALSNIKKHINSKPNDVDALDRLIRIQQERVEQSQKNKNWAAALVQQEKLIRLQKTDYRFKQWADINREIMPAAQQLKNYRDLLWQYPNHQWLIGDTIAAYSQQGEYAQAVKILPQLNASKAPSYALEHGAYSARKMQQTNTALALYRTGIKRFPNNTQFHLGKALCLIDQHKNKQAAEILSALTSRNDDIGIHQAMALNYAERGMQTQELLQHQAILEAAPSNSTSYRKMVLLTLDLGSTETAFKLAEQHPEWLNKNDWRRLYADRAAIAIRWANLHERNIDEYTARLTAAQQYLDDYRTYLSAHFPEDKSALFQSQNDRLLLLSLMQEPSEVVTIYQELTEAGIPIPDDSHRIAASAYLNLQQPNKSLAILNRLADNDSVLGQKYYAYLDTNQPDLALATTQQQKSLNPIWLAHSESKFLAGNSTRVAVDTNEKLLPAYSNRLSESQQLLQKFLSQGPANTELRNHIATIYRWRGWPRKALNELALIEAVEPNYLSMRVNKIHNQMDIYEYKNIDNSIAVLEQEHYRATAIKSVKETWALEKSPSLEVSASAAQASGSRFSSRDKTLQSRLNSALINRHVRLFARALYKTNNQTQGGSFKRMGVGAQWRSKNLQLSSEINQSFDGGNAGLGLSASWFKDDHWTLSTELESYSDQTPLRAYAQDIKLSRYAFNINHTQHESRSSNLNVSLGDFSDGNQRLELGLTHRFALKRSASHLVYARLGLGWQHNKNINSNYFNPSALTTLSSGVDYTGTLHQHYSQYFKHSFSLDLALQNQSGFGQGLVPAFSYTHLWQANKRLNGSYGISYSMPVFDGARENSISYFAQLQWKF